MRCSAPALWCLTLTALLGCSAAMPEQTGQPLAWVTTAVVDDDSKEAIARGDFRLLTFPGRGIAIPGIAESDQTAAEQLCSLRYLEGTGDVIRSDAEIPLREQVRVYTEKYNRIIYRACRQAHRDYSTPGPAS